MNYSITTLVENRPDEKGDLMAENGLSFFITTPEGNLVFDMGEAGAFLKNLKTLGLDLDRVSKMVVSHGHHDHGNGLLALLEEGPQDFELYVGEGFFKPKVKGPRGETFTGLKYDEETLRRAGVRVKTVTADLTPILGNVFLVKNFKRDYPDAIDPSFALREGRGLVPDPFTDEIALVVKGEQGLVLLVGCSHPGIENMIKTVEDRFEEPLHALIGGTHLRDASLQRIQGMIALIRERGIKVIGLNHCTGEKALSEMQGALPGVFADNRTGSVFSFD